MSYEPFTLAALLRVLTEAGYKIADSGDDLCPWLAGLRTTPPQFWVRVDIGCGELLPPTTALMDLTWSRFERGQMEFNAFKTRDDIACVIKQLHQVAAGEP